MPYKKLKNKDGSFKVVNSQTGKIHAKSTTESNADAQMRLLYSKDNDDDLGWNTPRDEATRILKNRRV